MRLAPPLDGWLVRQGGRGHRITVVFRTDALQKILYVALLAFGGKDWITEDSSRKGLGKQFKALI